MGREQSPVRTSTKSAAVSGLTTLRFLGYLLLKILRRIKQKETKFLFELKLNQAATCCIGDCFRPANDIHLGEDAFHM
jgi:hypothetical protein